MLPAFDLPPAGTHASIFLCGDHIRRRIRIWVAFDLHSGGSLPEDSNVAGIVNLVARTAASDFLGRPGVKKRAIA